MTTTILFLASSPEGETRLALDKECRSIREKIRSTDFPKDLELKSEWAVRPGDLLQYFNQFRPQVVHFSGHGSDGEELILQDENDQVKPVSKAALRALFKTMKDNIRLVVFNACYSQAQAEAVTEVIDCAVGMKTEIGNKAAIVFSAAFYSALGFGRSVQDAFDQGCLALQLESIPEEDTPKLHVRHGVDARQVFLAGPPSNPPPSNPPPSPIPPKPNRDLVYISYSHRDKHWFQRLRAILDTDPDIRDLIWDDTCIPPGKNFAIEIDQHVSRARIMIMLTSEPYFGPNSGAAKFETGPGLQAHRNGEIDILWFPVGVHSLGNSPVGHIMAATGSGAIPLELLSTEEQEEALRKVHQAVRLTLGLKPLQLVNAISPFSPKSQQEHSNNMNPPNVFISYSHDSEPHRQRVLGLSERLRADGVSTTLDRYFEHGSPDEGWPRWMMNGLNAATHILCVCTETYHRRFLGQEVPGAGKGADWEGALITQALYDARSRTNKFIPVLLQRSDEAYIPAPLRGQSYYVLDSDAGYQSLYDALLGQAGVEPGTVGELKRKPRATAQPLSFDAATPLQSVATPPVSSGALKTWQEKLDFLLVEEAICIDPAMKFRLKHLIEEATQKIRSLGGTA